MEEGTMQIGAWVPTHSRFIAADLAAQLQQDMAHVVMTGNDWRWNYESSSGIDRMRNAALLRSMERGDDYLLMNDSDVYRHDGGSVIRSLLETAKDRGAAVVSTIVGLRRFQMDQVEPNVSPFKFSEVYEAELVGTGQILIDVNAMRQIAKEYEGPFFAFTYKDKRHTELHLGEDIFFSQIVKGHGGQIWVDGRVPTTHLYLDREHLKYDPENKALAAV
jgi:hypothetical protein